jgi:tocopherol O-methyltransferase
MASTPQANGSISKVEEEKENEVIAKYDIPEPEPFISFNALKDRIRHHYELASDNYYSLW